jgi:hypothetical protein
MEHALFVQLLLGERSVSYIVLAILSVALVRLAVVCMYPRRGLAAEENSVE